MIYPPEDTSADLVPMSEPVIADETDDQAEIIAEPDEEIIYPDEETDDLLEHSLPIEVINVVSNDETDEVTVEPEIMKTPPVEEDILPKMNITFCDMTDDETADTTPEPEIAEPEPIVLAANSRDKMRLSEEFPYSVMVRSYKEEQNANGDADRLCNDDWDAYVVKSYDDETYFSFDVLVSAYKTEDEAAEVVRQFEEKGIHGTEIVEYSKVRQRADRYDEVVRTQNVIFDSGNGQMSNIFGDYVRRAVEGFPLNPFYDIRNITVTDNDSQSERMQTSPDNGEFAEWVTDGSHVHALVSAEYHDELYNKSMFVSIAAGDSGDFILEEEAVGVRVTVQAKGDTYSGVKYQTETGWQLVAKNEDGSLIIHFAGDNIGQSELDMFIGEIYSQSKLL
ncbi:MAG: SPOR domain-containing protein [Spirochaetales bacterium]|nr:SPOR domain-containing protein [Spirochaetales bacterium]